MSKTKFQLDTIWSLFAQGKLASRHPLTPLFKRYQSTCEDCHSYEEELDELQEDYEEYSGDPAFIEEYEAVKGEYERLNGEKKRQWQQLMENFTVKVDFWDYLPDKA